MTQAAVSEKEAKSAALKARSEDMDKREAAENAKRTGKGTRYTLAMTRGKGTTEVNYESFHLDKPDTLPGDLTEFMALTEKFGGRKDENLLAWLVDGFNENQYTAASDPIADFVNAAWADELKKNFRLAVRNYSNGVGVTIEDAVSLIKPGFDKMHDKNVAATKAAATA
jgi:hypothetical protein